MYNGSLESVLSGNIEKDYFTLFTGISMNKFEKDQIRYPLRTFHDLKQKGYAMPIS